MTSNTYGSVPTNQHLHIAIFNTEDPTFDQPSSANAFQGIMNRTASRLFGPNLRLDWTVYNVRNDSLPSDNDFSTIHAVMITGSTSDVPDIDAWVSNLANRIRTAYRNFPHVKWYGSDFGHQMICDSLLAEWGYKRGLLYRIDSGHYVEFGPQAVQFRPRFKAALRASEARTREAYAHLLTPTPPSDQGPDFMPTLDEVLDRGYVVLQFAHVDQMWPPSADMLLPIYIPGITGMGQPPDADPLPFVRDRIYQIGFNRWCGMLGMYVPGRIFTLQGRIEVGPSTAVSSVGRFLESVGFPADWTRASLEDALMRNSGWENDRDWVAERVLWFFLSEPEVLPQPSSQEVVAGIADDNELSVMDRVWSRSIHPSRVEVRLDSSGFWIWRIWYDSRPSWLPRLANGPGYALDYPLH